MPRNPNSLYFHIGNGGVSVTVDTDERGVALIRVSANHMGHRTACTEWAVQPDAIPVLAQFFAEQASRHFTRVEWGNAAETPNARESVRCGVVGGIAGTDPLEQVWPADA